jgi:hypothetical protein
MGTLHRIGKTFIRVYPNDHAPPHFHAVSPDFEALIEIATLDVLIGSLPRGKTGRAILKWAADNKAELVAEWNRINPRLPSS